MSEPTAFIVDTITVSDLGGTIISEAQGQLLSDPHNLNSLITGMNSSIQQLPSTISGPVLQFVNDFYSNYDALLNQRIVIGKILEGKVAPSAQALDLQIKDTFDSFQ